MLDQLSTCGRSTFRVVTKQSIALALQAVDLDQNRLDVDALLLERSTALRQHLGETLKLGGGIAHAAVHVEQFVDFGKRKTESLAAQDQFETSPVSLGIHPGSTGPRRLQQALIFVEADRTWRNVKLAGELCNGEGLFAGHIGMPRSPAQDCDLDAEKTY